MSFAASYQASQPLPTDIELVETLKRAGFDTCCMVADSVFSIMDQYLSDKQHEGVFNRWGGASERSIPAVAEGRWLATGMLTIMLMQNSGFRNAMDYLRALLLAHNIPGLVISGWRSYDALKDDSETHVLVGNFTESDSVSTLEKDHVVGQIDGNNQLEHFQSVMDDVWNDYALTDEMMQHRNVSDASRLKDKTYLTDVEMIDLVSLNSQYVLFELTNNVIRVRIEDSLSEIESLKE